MRKDHFDSSSLLYYHDGRAFEHLPVSSSVPRVGCVCVVLVPSQSCCLTSSPASILVRIPICEFCPRLTHSLPLCYSHVFPWKPSECRVLHLVPLSHSEQFPETCQRWDGAHHGLVTCSAAGGIMVHVHLVPVLWSC